MYGIQTGEAEFTAQLKFENDVKMYGIQTVSRVARRYDVFENDVKMYGIQTSKLGSAKTIVV